MTFRLSMSSSVNLFSHQPLQTFTWVVAWLSFVSSSVTRLWLTRQLRNDGRDLSSNCALTRASWHTRHRPTVTAVEGLNDNASVSIKFTPWGQHATTRGRTSIELMVACRKRCKQVDPRTQSYLAVDTSGSTRHLAPNTRLHFRRHLLCAVGTFL